MDAPSMRSRRGSEVGFAANNLRCYTASQFFWGACSMEWGDRRSVRFGEFEVDFRARELRRHGSRIKLQRQPFEVLQMLLERPGEVLSREELQHRIWPADTFVDFDQ